MNGDDLHELIEKEFEEHQEYKIECGDINYYEEGKPSLFGGQEIHVLYEINDEKELTIHKWMLWNDRRDEFKTIDKYKQVSKTLGNQLWKLKIPKNDMFDIKIFSFLKRRSIQNKDVLKLFSLDCSFERII